MKDLEKYLKDRIKQIKKQMKTPNTSAEMWWYCYGKILAFKSVLRIIKEGESDVV